MKNRRRRGRWLRAICFFRKEGASQVLPAIRRERAAERMSQLRSIPLSEATRTATDRFVREAIAQLRWTAEDGDDGSLKVDVPPALQGELGDRCQLVVSFSDEANGAAPSDESDRLDSDRLTAEPDGELVDVLSRQLLQENVIAHRMPADQPASAGALADRLLSAYEVAGGAVHLAGCMFEDRPFVRLTYRVAAVDENSPPRLGELFFDDRGVKIEDEQVASLGLGDVRPLANGAARHDPRRLFAAIESSVESLVADQADAETIGRAIVWCKYTSGKLRFQFPHNALEQRFEGWARTIEAPPVVCPVSGRPSHRIATTDDGRIVVAGAIGTCEESGRRVVVEELVRCAVSGKMVVADLTTECPASGSPVLTSLLKPCAVCGQSVSPEALASQVCLGCRKLAAVEKADPRMARLLDQYPALDRWKRWRLAETAVAYILVARGVWQQLLVVVDKETLAPLRVSTGSRLSKNWSPLEPIQYNHWLGRSREG
jgi:hypothetical protein